MAKDVDAGDVLYTDDAGVIKYLKSADWGGLI